MAKRIRLVCVWAGPVFFVFYLIAFADFARFIPPPSPSWGPDQITQVTTDNAIEIRVGMVLGLIVTTAADSVLRGHLDTDRPNRKADAAAGADAVRRCSSASGVL
ncbi:hypothetical protein [Mycolicibacterium fortuitum]|uniref:hypothetical protein n=1 Tax=Mycolicibacterium fortuitum TaxID=1766 RepID=UPI001054465E|nr:hypothetical protein [Mycolicibacterium fortuitum]